MLAVQEMRLILDKVYECSLLFEHTYKSIKIGGKGFKDMGAAVEDEKGS